MHSEPQASFQQLEALIQARHEAHAQGRAADAQGAEDRAAALTARLLAQQTISAGELAHLHLRMRAQCGA